MQNILIIIIVGICAYYIGRRFYKNMQSQKGTGCGCSCSGCGADKKSTCPSENTSDNAH